MLKMKFSRFLLFRGHFCSNKFKIVFPLKFFCQFMILGDVHLSCVSLKKTLSPLAFGGYVIFVPKNKQVQLLFYFNQVTSMIIKIDGGKTLLGKSWTERSFSRTKTRKQCTRWRQELDTTWEFQYFLDFPSNPHDYDRFDLNL